MVTDYKPYDVELLSTTLSTNGTYTLNDDVTKYGKLQVLFGTKQTSGASPINVNPAGMSLVPTLVSNIDQGYICTSSTIFSSNNNPYLAFGNVDNYWWVSARNLITNQWLQIQKTDGKLRTNMFSLYHGGSPNYNYTYTHLKIQGSNDGENWDTLVEDNPVRGIHHWVEVYLLDDYVEYSYFRVIGDVVSTYACIRKFCIQDSALHLYSGDDYEASKTADGFSYTGNQGTVTITGNQLVLSDLTTPVASISGLSTPIIPHYYKLYRKGTDGTPTLFMPEQTTIGSSLGHVDLQADLASLASKQYVTDTIDNLSRSSLGGKVPTYEDLPKLRAESYPYTAPELTADGTPYVDEYAVSVSSMQSGSVRAYNATNKTANYYWHTAAVSSAYYYMYFKSPTVINHIFFQNRSVTSHPTYSIPAYIIQAKNKDDETWVNVSEAATNSVTAPSGSWEFTWDNEVAYDAYRVRITSTRGYVCQSSIIPSGSVNYVGHDTIREGTIYLVGTDGNLEEYMLTRYGWERLGEIRHSDVNLSGYTNTEGLNSAINTATTDLDLNVGAMTTDVETALTELESTFEASLLDLPKETQFLEDAVPATWPDHIEDNGMMLIIEPEYEVQPYTAPHITTNGIPYEDEYAVSTDGEYGSMFAHEASHMSPDRDTVWCSKNTVMPQYFNMVFKQQLRATSMQLVNRYYSPGYPVHPIHEFTLEARVDSTSTWEPLYSDSHTEIGSGVSATYEFENDKFYHEYRLVIHSAHDDWAIINLLQLIGDVKKV